MMRRMSASPLRAATLTQLTGAAIAFSLIWITDRSLLQMPLLTAVLQGVCAAFVSWRFGAPRWWWLIHLGFMPLIVLALALQIPPGWYLAAFVTTLLVFWRTDRSRVPLYLSNAVTAQALLALLPATPCRVADIGCGDGRFLRALARARPDCTFVGIEHAPAVWLLARLMNMGQANVEVRYGDLWSMSLKPYAVLYAFLSPTPMPALWQKACNEMVEGSLLVSNSFAIPEVTPEQVIEVADRRQTRLYCYHPVTA